jgi:hypothetical protein
MNLDDFVKIMSSDLAEFKANWEAQRRESPDKFPSEMAEGDWFEQFLFFVEHRGQENDDPPCRPY